jgi:serine/threonine-protein kinase
MAMPHRGIAFALLYWKGILILCFHYPTFPFPVKGLKVWRNKNGEIPVNTSNKQPLLEKGDVLNEKWEILEHIATGGMAEVYRARQIKLDREVAVKVLSQEFLDSFEGDDKEIQVAFARFDREVKAMAQVRHPNVLQIFDHDRADVKVNSGEISIQYIAMEYIPGPSLRTVLLPEGMQTNEKEIRNWIHRYFLPIMDGVETVHGLGIVHRDLKPENVLLDGLIPKIMDFGLAAGKQWKPVTQSHHIAGTAPYQAYEQFIDMGETDVRADIYSLGKMLYEVVIGKMDKKQALFWKTARLPDPNTPFLRRLDRIIQQATAEDKSERTPSVDLLRQAILELLEEKGESTARLGRFFYRRFGKRKLISLFSGLVLIGAISVGFHILYHREKTVPPISSIQTLLPEASEDLTSDLPQSTAVPTSPPTPTLVGKDGATLRLIPGGEVILPKNFGRRAGNSVQVNSFYMDETEVTNHQYVEFLNGVLSRIRVEGGVVKGDGDLWLLLGEVTKGYEPIVFRDGRLFLKDPTLASHPVVRVTAAGAGAYARFYGRRLPTEIEWLHAMKGSGDVLEKPLQTPSESSGMMDMETMHGQMSSSSPDKQAPPKILVPVIYFKPDTYGIRGLEENVSEWGVAIRTGATQKDEKSPYVILPSMIPRQPWEAFEEVGFRTVASILGQKK